MIHVYGMYTYTRSMISIIHTCIHVCKRIYTSFDFACLCMDIGTIRIHTDVFIAHAPDYQLALNTSLSLSLYNIYYIYIYTRIHISLYMCISLSLYLPVCVSMSISIPVFVFTASISPLPVYFSMRHVNIQAHARK